MMQVLQCNLFPPQTYAPDLRSLLSNRVCITYILQITMTLLE